MVTITESQAKKGHGPHFKIGDLDLRKEQALERMRTFIRISRGYLMFLKEDDYNKRSTTRAFLFDSLLKSMILIVDEVIGHFEKHARDQVANAISKIKVRMQIAFLSLMFGLNFHSF